MAEKRDSSRARPTGDGELLDSLFGIDVRALAALRIGIGGLLLADLWFRSNDLVAHYTDEGMLPRAARVALSTQGDPSRVFWWMSLHNVSGQPWFQYVLFAIAAIAAGWVVLGYRTRTALLVSWLLLVSLQARNPFVLQGGDLVLRCLVFWSLFLPMGVVWSLDAVLRPPRVSVPGRVLSVGSAALLLQLGIVYTCSALLKTDSMWRHDLTAAFYALHIDHLTTPLGIWLRGFPGWLKWLTGLTWLLELAGPLFLFSPASRSPRFRTFMVVMFFALHLGFAATMALGLFPWICIVYWMAFLPSQTWDFAQQFGRKVGNRVPRRLSTTVVGAGHWLWSKTAPLFRWPETPRHTSSVFANSLAACLLLVVVWSNASRLDGDAFSELQPQALAWCGKLSALDQHWNMFSPRPHEFGGWFIFQGTLADGSVVNLWDPGAPLPTVKPRLVSAMYPNQRCRKCLMSMYERELPLQREAIADYLRRRWDRGHSFERRVAMAEIILMVQPTAADGRPRGLTQCRTVVRRRYVNPS